MIPKIIHYCWISDESTMPDDIKKCIASWHEHMPDYKFINWNDSNFDWDISEFTKNCRENNLYAFCSDYVRFWALYNYGGIYLDSDVSAFKSFDELLKCDRVITKEVFFTQNDYFEAAIMASKKQDPVMGKILDWYNNTDMVFSRDNFKVSPDVMTNILYESYEIKKIFNLDEYIQSDDVISLFDCDTFFNHDSEKAFAQHQFKHSWCGNIKDCTKNDECKIFLCSHKPIDNLIPKNKKYVILDVTGRVNNSYNDNFHKIIDIHNDEFVKSHNICYSEGAAMHWLWKHPEEIPDYICFGHYRRYFLDFVGREKYIPRTIDGKGVIVQEPFDHTQSRRKTIIGGMYQDHCKDDMDAFIESVREAAPEYWETFQEYLDNSTQYGCNIFGMKKEDFLEMCEMCFRVLEHFDQKMGYSGNYSVYNKMLKEAHRKRLYFGVNWQSRLQGFLLEWLTDIYYRQKYNQNKICKSKVGIIENKNN